MRLTSQQQDLIRDLVRPHLAGPANVVVFGSPVDNSAIGGDIDLLVELSREPLLARAIALSARLEQQLGAPVDLITTYPSQRSRPIVELARPTGTPL